MRLIKFADDPRAEDTEQGRIAKLEVLYQAADAERKKAEREWFANIAALAGKHSEALVRDLTLYRKIRIPYIAQKADGNVNLLYALARAAAAAGVDNAAQQIAVPATSEPQDLGAAELATDLIESRYIADDEYNLRLHEELWRLTTGFCVRNTFWDADKPGVGWGGEILPGAGEIETRMLTPLHIHVCPWVDSSRPRPWYIISDVRDVDEIKELYGKEVEAEDVASDIRTVNRLLSSAISDGAGGAPERRKHAVILKRLYHEPTPKFPDGRVWTWSGGKLLDEGDLPEGEMPLVEIIWFPVPGRIYPYPFLTPLVGLQREINKTLSQLVELKNRQLRGDILVRGNPPTEENENPILTDWDTETGQKRIWLDPSVLDFQFMQYNLDTTQGHALIQLKWENMQRIAGLHDPSTGESAGVAQTATEVAVLKEADTAGLALFRNMRDRAQSKVERQKIILAKNHYHIPRFISVVGEYNVDKTHYFFGAELRGVNDVRVKPSPMLTEAMKQQVRRDLAIQGAWDFTGPIQLVAAKVKLIMESGLPNPDKEVEQLTGGITVEQIFQANKLAIEQAMETQVKQAAMVNAAQDAQMAQAAGGGTEAEQPETMMAA